MLLDNIKSPQDIKNFSTMQLNELANESRSALLHRLSECGGHIGPNLGIVEVTIALHYVFNSPIDKIVFDVSHQSYTHKLLTGRSFGFTDDKRFKEITGYSAPEESEHDFFTIGHTSTSISLASGLMKGRDLLGKKENIIALIGDGSLSGGEAFEGLDSVAEIGTNMIIVVNDNDMSIAENHGGLYRNLAQLRETKGECEVNYFKAMGLDYCYVEDGHNIEKLIETFQKVKDIDHPIVVHIHTIKGKGFKPAELEKEQWHWVFPFALEDGSCKLKFEGEDFGTLTSNLLLDAMKNDPGLVAITAGTPMVFGFNKEKRLQAGLQFMDVGIAEAQAVAMASGIAKAGGKPVFGVYSTFIQRTYDQISQDLCINNNPAVFLVFCGSVYGMSDVTHLGFYDVAMLSNIPNLVYMSPVTADEYEAMLAWALQEKEHPVAIRIPCHGVIRTNIVDKTDYNQIHKFEMVKKGSKVAIIAAGDFWALGLDVYHKLSEKCIESTLINPKYLSGIDEEMLEKIKENHDIVVTLEDGILEGGFGSKVALFYGNSDMKVLSYGLKKQFEDHYNLDDLLTRNKLKPEIIAKEVHDILISKDKTNLSIVQ